MKLFVNASGLNIHEYSWLNCARAHVVYLSISEMFVSNNRKYHMMKRDVQLYNHHPRTRKLTEYMTLLRFRYLGTVIEIEINKMKESKGAERSCSSKTVCQST